MLEAKVLIERWRVNYNTIRPPRSQNASAGGYQPPALEKDLDEFNHLRTGTVRGAGQASKLSNLQKPNATKILKEYLCRKKRETKRSINGGM